jgi:hypothetical protein
MGVLFLGVENFSTTRQRSQPPPRCLDTGDVDLLHRRHRLEGTLCLPATSRKRIGQHARGGLAGEPSDPCTKAEMGVADHVLESITGHLSRRMLEHYSHIRIDAKRQALDALDVQCGRVLPVTGHGNGGEPEDGDAGIAAIVEIPESVTSQSRYSLTLSGSRPSGKLLIPFERRDVRVVEGARLEIDSDRAQ